MRKLALGALLFGAFGLFAGCGGGGGSDPDTGIIPVIDGGGGDDDTVDAMVPTAACNPVTQTGCDPGEKCTWVRVTEALARTDCAADGTLAVGAECTPAAVPTADPTADDCAAGAWCGGVCEEICGTEPDTCADGFSCLRVGGVFTDAGNVGTCNDNCDPVAQDCGDETQACYLSYATGLGLCLDNVESLFDEDVGGQDQQCFTEPEGGPCVYSNGCRPGFNISLRTADSTGFDGCGQLCIASPIVADGDPDTIGIGTCPLETHECRYISSFFYPPADVPEPLPANLGLCMPNSEFIPCAEQYIGDDPDPVNTGYTPVDPATDQDNGGCVPYDFEVGGNLRSAHHTPNPDRKRVQLTREQYDLLMESLKSQK